MSDRKPMTLHRLREMRASGEKIAMLTCYDAVFAHILDVAGVDVLLVGDSLGMVLQGRDSTLSVSMDEMSYHTRCVVRGNQSAWIIADMPFGSYQESPELALRNAVTLMREGAQMVKLEGGAWIAATVRFLVARGIPVCGHVGFTPQSVHALGGYRVQGRNASAAQGLKEDVLALADAGAAMLVLEMIPSVVTRELADAVTVPLIGIGAGAGCSGQVLVLHDMLGLTRELKPKFVRNFMEGQASIAAAVHHYVDAVKNGTFPDDTLHGY